MTREEYCEKWTAPARRERVRTMVAGGPSERRALAVGACSVQPSARRHGNDGTHGNRGNMASVSYRFLRAARIWAAGSLVAINAALATDEERAVTRQKAT